ncbi:MAG: hypothetical protein IJM59_10830 [Proteobacteria bacterium]|nr:hypothetical protein [Pseudomonadota bacterium]
MKTRIYLFALMACMFMGCDMSEVVDWGADCPGKDAEGELSYIGDPACTSDNGASCQIEGKTYDFSTNFNIKRCPPSFSVCVGNDPEGIYHCEKETKTKCAEKHLACPKGDNPDDVECIDPASSKTCGADDCNKKNYGGQDCSKFGKLSSCELNSETNKYMCRCQNGALLCGSECISPGNSRYCGANDCSKDNYGGQDCSTLPGSECQEYEKDKYRCECRDDSIKCGETCINPSSDSKHCGAKGSCSSEDPDNDDYQGEDCESGHGICTNGTCACPSEQIWCVLPEEEKPRCVSPHEPESCGAHKIEGTNQCEADPCTFGQSCSSSAEGYKCTQTECEDSQMLCPSDGEMKCTPKEDPMNCGACGMKCESQTNGFAHGNDCRFTDNEYKCTFVCNEGYTNCTPEDEFNPGCKDLQHDDNNCGKCGFVCPSDKTCKDGVCTASVCKENQCAITDVNGKISCFNEVFQCGSKCLNCEKSPVKTAKCDEGTCVAINCETGNHLNNQTCEKNDKSDCGPTNGPGINCIVQNITDADCSATGTCVVTNCKANHHISADKTSCVSNSDAACGAANSNTPVDCTKLDNVVKASCQEGKCAVTECKPGYHLNASQTDCEANSKTACASPTSNKVQNCTKITNSADVECAAGVCKVKSCATDYHLNTSATECAANTKTLCAPPNSSQTLDCTTIQNSLAVSCTSGKCTVTECKSGYHINSGKTGCDINSDTACGATNSSSVKNCTAGVEKVCVGGVCKCSKDNSTVLNFDKNACVIPACQGIPGVKEGKPLQNGKKCLPTKCLDNYSRTGNNSYAACRPKKSSFTCTDIGYKYDLDNTLCCGCSEAGCNNCDNHACNSGYKHYHYACLKTDVCCGENCINCLVDGKHCNTSDTACE